MRAAIITIGDEILIGQITDTNSQYIANQLEKIGITVTEIISISDNHHHIIQTFYKYQNKFDLVVITGGLGPTKDDVTKKTLCEYFEDKFIRNPEVTKQVDYLFRDVLKKEPTQVNYDQALVPSKATILFNEFGTAPGMWMKKESTVFVSLPGVPYEMRGIVDNYLIPKLVKEFDRPYIVHKTFLTVGEGESSIAERIENWEENLPDYLKFAYLPKPGSVRLRLTGRHTDIDFLNQSIDEATQSLMPYIKDIFVGLDDDISLVEKIQLIMISKQYTLSTAESCTGGSIASQITSVAGSSGYYNGSIVCYDTMLKTDFLNVNQKTIDTHSVVSTQVALEMAHGIKNQFKTTFGIATTGNAGPSKKESDALVGTVCIAIVGPNIEFVEQYNFGQPREKVIQRAVNKAFEVLYKEIIKN